MRLSELTAYAEEKYGIREDHKWADFPGFSVLSEPVGKKWIALLMRRFDAGTGEESECCDLKCGREILETQPAPYFSEPFRMKGPRWLGVRFDEDTDSEAVKSLFDAAVALAGKRGAELLQHPGIRKGFGDFQKKEAQKKDTAPVYHDTAISFGERRPGSLRRGGNAEGGSLRKGEQLRFGSLRSGRTPELYGEEVPPRILEMVREYRFGRGSFEEKCRNFVRQGRLMADYEDDYDWNGSFTHYFPTYHDLNVRQLRGYFSWRTKARKGDFRKIPDSMAYLYLYELLNGIGTDTAAEAFRRMAEFEAGYLDRGFGDAAMRKNLRRWMFEFTILQGLPEEMILQAADAGMLERDRMIAVLRGPEEEEDGEVCRALAYFAGSKPEKTPVLSKEGARGARLFASLWRKAAQESFENGKDLFTLSFGEIREFPWHPFANAVWLSETKIPDREIRLGKCRAYRCRGGRFTEECFADLYIDRSRLKILWHAADRLFRRYLKTGAALKERPEEAWAIPLIEEVIEEDKEAKRPKIVIDFSGLEAIRKAAEETRDSLLTEEELLEEAPVKETAGTEGPAAENPPASSKAEDRTPEAGSPLPDDPDSPLSPVQREILTALLSGNSPEGILKRERLLPSIAADEINEALYDEIGDTVLLCMDDRLLLVDDYREDIAFLLGGL